MEDGPEMASPVDGAGVGLQVEALDERGVLRMPHDVADGRARRALGEPHPSPDAAAGDEPARPRQGFGDFDEMVRRNAVVLGDLARAHRLPGPRDEVDEQPQGVVGVVGELHGSARYVSRHCSSITR